MRGLTFFADAGHGWLRVPRAELVRLGVDRAISPYSYQRGSWVYLEEDEDYSRFLRACEARGEAPIIRHAPQVDRSAIRRYERYWPMAAVLDVPELGR